MKKLLIIWVVVWFSIPGYGQVVEDFTLMDVVSGKDFSLSQHKSSPAIVLIFTSNTCPFSKLYEQRILDLANRFESQNYRFVLVNPQAEGMEGESVEDMISRSQDRLGNMSYLADRDQKLAQKFGISKIPEVVVISSGPTGFAVAYHGAIDNNPQLAQSASRNYLMDALQSISDKKAVSPASTRSVGCTVRPEN